jgi:hypothetical protein
MHIRILKRTPTYFGKPLKHPQGHKIQILDTPNI